ncbi:unnamed protein product (macronuclear) [Paramecium tetraurelia]|uniref:H-type lectin domain-containing protein n=1 Tax=Paramecium tetraurelia TaxID=5888 RepID=A0CMS0_PARTE|nr:uncharacterized protein GSPATT00008566001 [Paramecium tetraurelia]CAK72087.1 unnamed protein product [Paramecium tetraurelia]|eukprot:XP_001439484.1 hypothetical protein (macronuclear) [Paramecium tetraurelia strain d4-2]
MNLLQIILELILNWWACKRIVITLFQLLEFTVGTTCSGPTLYTFGFRWVAMDSEDIYVVNSFTTTPAHSLTYPHSAPNATAAFVSLFTFGYTGEVKFQIQVIELNSTHVTVGIDNINNLRTLGFQIILHPISFVKIVDSINAMSSFTSPSYALQPKSFFIMPFQGFWHIPDTENVTIKHTQTQTSTDISYTSDSQGNTYYLNNTHLVLWIINDPLPAECTTIRITQIKDLQASTRPTIQISVPELNLVYDTLGQYDLKLTASQVVINIQVYAKCFKNKKYVSQFNKCNTCQSKRYMNFTHNCYGAINTLIYTARLTQTMLTSQQLVLYLYATSCKITWLLQTSVIEETIILQVQQQTI